MNFFNKLLFLHQAIQILWYSLLTKVNKIKCDDNDNILYDIYAKMDGRTVI